MSNGEMFLVGLAIVFSALTIVAVVSKIAEYKIRTKEIEAHMPPKWEA